MNIWNDIEIEWEGQKYTVRPTLSFINTLEQGQGRSLSNVLIRMSQGDLPSGIACELIAKTLNTAGVEATAEDVFIATGGIGEKIMELTASIIMACLPEPKEAGEQKKTKE